MSAVREFAGAVVGALLALGIGHCNEGCRPAQTGTLDDVYEAEIRACIQKGEDPQYCRGKVDAKYNVCWEGERIVPCHVP